MIDYLLIIPIITVIIIITIIVVYRKKLDWKFIMKLIPLLIFIFITGIAIISAYKYNEYREFIVDNRIISKSGYDLACMKLLTEKECIKEAKKLYPELTSYKTLPVKDFKKGETIAISHYYMEWLDYSKGELIQRCNPWYNFTELDTTKKFNSKDFDITILERKLKSCKVGRIFE